MGSQGRQGSIAKAAGVMSAATLISRVLGFVRDMTLASFFGAAGASDTFFVAFRIPNLLRELFAEGSMSSAFVPVLARVEAGEGRAEATRLVRAALTFMVLLVGTVCALGVLFAPEIVVAIAPGFRADPEKLALTVLMTRIMFPFLLFVSLAALVMGALNTRRVFFVPALASAVFNAVWIAAVPAARRPGAVPPSPRSRWASRSGGARSWRSSSPPFCAPGTRWCRRSGSATRDSGAWACCCCRRRWGWRSRR